MHAGLANVLKKIRLAWLDFCTSTGIKGFSFIVRSDGLPEQLLWGALIITCASLTIWDVSKTVGNYMQQQTMTKTNVSNNETIDLGSPSVCIDLKVQQLKFGSLDLHNVSSVSTFLAKMGFITDLTTYLNSSLSEMKRFRRNSVKLLSTASKVPDFYSFDPLNIQYGGQISGEEFLSFLSLIVSTFSAIVRFEHLVDPDLDVNMISWGLTKSISNETFEATYIDYDSSLSIYDMYKFIGQKSTNPIPVWQTAGAILCEMMNLEIILKGRNGTNGKLYANAYDPCLRERITWLGTAPFSEMGMELLCVSFELEQAAFLFDNPEQCTYVYLNTSNVFTENAMGNSVVRVDFTGSPVSTADSQQFANVPFGEQIELHANLQGEYRELNTTTDPCAVDSILYCRLKRRANYSTTYCGCEPVSVQHLKQNQTLLDPAKMCIYDSKDGYMTVKGTGKDSQMCYETLHYYYPGGEDSSKRCLKVCESRIYSVRIPPKPKTLIDLPGATLITVSVDSFLYPTVFEVIQMDSIQLISTIGGNLNFYLGASFIVLTHALVFFVRVPFEIAFTKIVRSPLILSHNHHHAQMVIVRGAADESKSTQESKADSVPTGLEDRLIRKLLESEEFRRKVLSIAAERRMTNTGEADQNRWANQRY